MSGAEAVLDQLVNTGGAVWRASWQASVLAVLVVAVQLILGKRIAARWRHAMWMLVLVRLALPVVPSSPVSVFNLAPAKAQSVQRPPSLAPIASIKMNEGTIAWTHSLTVDTSPSALPQTPVVIAQSPSPDLWTGWPQVLATLWGIGVALLATRIAFATWRVSRTLGRLDPVDDPAVQDVLRSTAAELRVRRLPKLLAGDGLFSPALVGFVRPKLLVPRDVLASFDPSELRLVFLHELAHLKRRDVAINWAATVLTVLHWPNPIAWLVVWRLRLERELACDELVMSRTSDTDRRAYGHTIVKLLETFSRGAGAAGARPLPAGGVGILEGKAQMKRRITMIAQFARSSRAWTAVGACLVLLLGVVALTDAVQAEDRTGATSAPATQIGAAPVIPVEASTSTARRNTIRPSNENIAWAEETVAAMQQERDELRQTRGEQHLRVVELTNKIAQHEKALRALGPVKEQLARAATQPTKLKVGDLVTVSVMDLVGPGVETIKTARIDGDGTINMPYAGQVKASGLSPRALEEAVLNALRGAHVVKDAVIVVSMPERGESHQLSRRALPSTASGVAETIIASGSGENASPIGAAPATHPARAPKLLTRIYDVAQTLRGRLLQRRPAGDIYDVPVPITELMNVISQTVQPHSWRSQGGHGTITTYGSKLIVVATEEVHLDIAGLLAMLREKASTQPLEHEATDSNLKP
ncbi:MAG: polysaccharide biosynthesis/export family protein [Planctomycetota bacterium]|nr:polysaccharide biosynthesis/export family protein [Planctomycetota bacterium]